jgi:hypothetical protein
MTDRFPLIINSEDQQIQELSSGDNLDLTGSGIIADVFTVDTNSEERLRIDSLGNMGLGTASPSGRLTIKDGGYRQGIVLERSASTVDRGFIYIGDGTNSTIVDEIYLDAYNTAFHFRQGAAGTTETVTFKADGSATFASGTSNAAGVEISKNNSNASYAPLYLKQANTSGNLITGRDDFNGVNTFTVSATGSATFASYVESDLFSVSRSSVENKDNYSSKLSIADTGKHFNAKDTGGTTVASINADGSATFGNSPVAFSFTSGYSGGLDLSKDGYSKFAVDTTGNLTSNGSATFAGYVKTSSNLICDTTSSSNGLYIGDFTNGNYYATIFGNGSATFLNRCNFGSSSVADVAGKFDNSDAASATLYVTNHNASGNIFSGRNASNSEVARIGADGSAEFAGGSASIDAAGGFQITSSTDARSTMNGDGIYQMKTDGTVAGMILADGRASFNGMVKTGSDNATLATGTWLQDIGGVYTTRPAGSTASAFACFQQGTGIYTASINADGSVFFARGNFQMDTAGVIQTNLYSAGTLNIDSSGSFGNPKIVLNASNGNGTFAGTVTESGSDRKFKENIVDAPAQLTDVSALQLRTWDWNDLTPGNEERNNRRSMGLVAQEAELIDSNLVYDVNEGEDTYKAVDYKVLTMKLLGAVKELAAKNETLEQRLSDAGIA